MSQAPVRIVGAISRIVLVPYAEIVTTTTRSAVEPAVRADLDGAITGTARAIELEGGAEHGKAILLLGPAERPVPTRHTVIALIYDPDGTSHDAIRDAVAVAITDRPELLMKQAVQIVRVPADAPIATLTDGRSATHQVSVLLEARA
jgi:acetaldehyde dehydrogenase